jgi:hypothetical protein
MKQLLALVFLLPVLAVAQEASPPTPQASPARSANLSPDETAKLASVRQQVLQQHPDWVQARNAYYARLVANQDGYTPDPAVSQGLSQIQASIEEAMKHLDPSTAPLLFKFHANGAHWGGGFTTQTVPPTPSAAPNYSPSASGAGQSHPEQVDIPPGN